MVKVVAKKRKKLRTSRRKGGRFPEESSSSQFNDSISDLLLKTHDSAAKLISTKDQSFVRHYFVTIDPNVLKVKDTNYDYVVKKIQEVLDHPKSWRNFGYKFNYIKPEIGLRLRQNKINWINTFWIRLVSAKVVEKVCGLPHLSCADLTTNCIYLNDHNWVYSTEASGMQPEFYRIYQILHEVGHLLNRHHPERWRDDPNKPCKVMSQQTIKPNKQLCYPNVFPLDD